MLIKGESSNRLFLYYCFPDVDECTSGPCLNGGTCIDAVNGYTCECTDLFTGIHCQLGKCVPPGSILGPLCNSGPYFYDMICVAEVNIYSNTELKAHLNLCTKN